MGVFVRSAFIYCGQVNRKHLRAIIWGHVYRTNNACLQQRIRDVMILLSNLTLRTFGEFRRTKNCKKITIVIWAGMQRAALKATIKTQRHHFFFTDQKSFKEIQVPRESMFGPGEVHPQLGSHTRSAKVQLN